MLTRNLKIYTASFFAVVLVPAAALAESHVSSSACLTQCTEQCEAQSGVLTPTKKNARAIRAKKAVAPKTADATQRPQSSTPTSATTMVPPSEEPIEAT